MVKATSFCRAALKKSMYMPLTKPTMSPLTSCRRALPVLMRLNSMSMFTCLSSREVPRRTVCSAERDGGRPSLRASLSAAPCMRASGVRNSWAIWVNRFSLNSPMRRSVSTCWRSLKPRSHSE